MIVVFSSCTARSSMSLLGMIYAPDMTGTDCVAEASIVLRGIAVAVAFFLILYLDKSTVFRVLISSSSG